MRDARCAILLSILLTSCAQIAGIGDFSVGDAPNPITEFLGGGACGECVTQSCKPELDTCASDRDLCAEPAECMAHCAETPWGGTDPACVITNCRGAEVPKDSLYALSMCAHDRCADPCEVGKSFGCVGKYNWPPAPSNGFDYSVSIDIWNDTWDQTPTRPHLVGAKVGLCNDTGENPNTPSLLCPDSPLGASDYADENGSVTLQVPPYPGIGVTGTPHFHLYVAPTPSSPPTQQFPTIGPRFITNAPLRPGADPIQIQELALGASPNGNTRFLCGAVLDCHGSRALAAEGLTASTNDPYPQSWIVVYWHADQNSYYGDKTDSTGIFCIFIGSTDSTTPDPSGTYALDLKDAVTGETRVHMDVGVPSEGHVQVGVLPPSASQL